MEKIKSSLAKTVIRNNRISFIFNNYFGSRPILRTTDLKNGNTKRKSLFDIYSQVILGHTTTLPITNEELIRLFIESSKGKLFNLEINESKCQKYFDILKIQRSSQE